MIILIAGVSHTGKTALFGLGKKKEEKTPGCCCSGNCTPEIMKEAEQEKRSHGVKILGGGCAKCNQL